MKRLAPYWWVLGLLLALAVTFLAPLASPHPDGLERVAEDQGFLTQAQDAPFQVLADYVFPGLSNEAGATIVAGLVGTLLVFGCGYGLGWLLRSRRPQPRPQ